MSQPFPMHVPSVGKLRHPLFGFWMGSAVSKTIVEAHGGRIWAENRPEGGVCFCFTVPVVRGTGESVVTDP
jgi:signal transduction histidine kinase